MTSQFRSSLIISICLFLAGCGTPCLSRLQADVIRPGESRASVTGKLGSSKPVTTHTFDYEGTNYIAEHYSLQIGSKQSGTMICSPTCIWIPITVPVLSPFVLIFSAGDNSVFAPGTIEELSKAENPLISNLMPVLKKSYADALSAKK